MLIDSHCHLNMLDLTEFDNELSTVLLNAIENDVQHFLTVCVDLEDYPTLCDISEKYPAISISVGLHPNSKVENEPTVEQFLEMSKHPACIAIGETGLDYYRLENESGKTLQQNRFRTQIQTAIQTSKPLIIHTRSAQEDTLRIMEEEKASMIGGVMHCFGENLQFALKAMEMNFYISFSGIITFKNASQLREVAREIPLDRILIETDSPFLAPVPFRGKQNHPALVKYVAETLSQIHQVNYETIAKQTTDNFYRCFKLK